MTTKRRLFALGAIAAITGVVTAVACSFPEPQLVPDEGGTATPDGPGAETDPPDALPDVDPGADVVEPDAPPPIDATTDKPFVDEAGCFCDCDKDGYRAEGQDAAACDANVSKTLIDCDDLDKRANPDAGFVKDQPTVDTRGDWNCDKVVNREIPGVNIQCAGRSTALPNECTGAQGFAGDPGCGVEATFVACEPKGFPVASCTEKENKLATQGCK